MWDGDDNVVSIQSPPRSVTQNMFYLSSETAWSEMLWWRHVSVKMWWRLVSIRMWGAQQFLISHCFASQSSILSIPFPCDHALARSSLKTSWISMAFIRTPWGSPNSQVGWLKAPWAKKKKKKAPWAMKVSNSAALNAKTFLSNDDDNISAMGSMWISNNRHYDCQKNEM